MKKTELLAPAGNMEALKAAVAGGCDAVYLGLSRFSARAFAGNFTHEELLEAVRYCHIRDVSVYVTINTMLYESEIEKVKEEIDYLYENDVDALLVQDFGLFHYLRECYQDFDVHCSTQMHIHNLAGVLKMQKEGASRVVMARETPLSLIREACRTGMEIEVFAYGAVCVSYSGQCLMSASIKNRSANRGVCAQCCRLRYYPDDSSSFSAGDYILSPKDLNVIDRLPELLSCGVSSLKIEGRMKRPAYVYLVTKTFREAIDAWYEGKSYKVSKERDRQLKLLFNRGFSEGLLFESSAEERMNPYRPNHVGIEIGKVVDCRSQRVCVRLSDTLHQHDGLRILSTPEDIGLTAVRIEKNGRLVNSAKAGDTVWLDCKGKYRPKKGQSLRKTTDSVLMDEIERTVRDSEKRIPVEMSYEAEQGMPFRLTVKDRAGREVTAESRIPCEAARANPLTDGRISASLAKTGDQPYQVSSSSGSAGNIFLPVSVINETRRSALEMLNDKRALRHERAGRKPYAFMPIQKRTDLPLIIAEGNARTVSQYGTFMHVMPVVDQEQNMNDPVITDSVLSQAGDLLLSEENNIAGYTLNCANSYSLAFLLSQPGVEAVVFSSEISSGQIKEALDAFAGRYGFIPFTYAFVYGRRPLMYIRKGFAAAETPSFLTDKHGNNFKVEYNNDMSLIIESKPLCRENRYCSGSYLIPGTDSVSADRIMEEAYEEIHGRI